MSKLYYRFIAAPPDGDCKMGFSLSGIKRAPHCIRQSLKLSTVTVDEEFELLLEELNSKEDQFKNFAKELGYYQAVFGEVIANSVKVGSSVKLILDPYFDGCTEPDGGSCEPFNNCKRYLSILDEARLNCDESLSAIPEVLQRKMHQLQISFDAIRKFIRRRDLALLDYDKTLDKFDPMSIKRSTGIMTVKQAQQYHTFERQVDSLKSHYDGLNNMLKLELPYFFKLVDAFMDVVLQYVFYVQLGATYQILQSVFTLETPMHFSKEEISHPDFIKQHIARFEETNSKKDPDLNIITFHRMHLELLLEAKKQSLGSGKFSNYEPFSTYCIALYDFAAQSEGDLTFAEGAIIKVVKQDGKWWLGEVNGQSGLFPSNFVKLMSNKN